MNQDPGYTSEPHVNRCPRCGKEMPEGALFCGECGFRLDANYTQPYTLPPQSFQPSRDETPLKTIDYLVLMILSSVPLLGWILLLVWAFSSNTNVNRRNFCRAQLIMVAINLLASVLLVAMYAILLGSATGSGAISTAFGMIFR